MRTTMGLATAAVLAVGSLGLGAATATTSQAAPAAPAAAAERTDVAQAAIDALRDHPGAARSSQGQALLVADTIVDPDGGTHVRLDRTYQGLRVLGGDLVVHQGAGATWEGVSQTLRTPIDLATTPRVGSDAASTQALAPTRQLRAVSGLRGAGRPELVVDATGAQPTLAWEVLSTGVRDDGTPSRLASYVDAGSGEVLRREEQIQTADGQGQSLYSGTVPLQVTQRGSTYEMRDATRGGTYTTDMGNATDSSACSIFGWGCKTGTIVTSPSTTFGNGTTSDRASAAVDAQYGTATTWDYFKSKHGRNGIFGNGSGSYNRVHYGKNYVNAFWDGTKMTYGDGDGVSFGPLVSLDVAGHEMSHGVTENTAGLTYSGESGGLNEATSDIFGTMVEFHAANASDPGDYLIGEEFDLANSRGFRRMDNPIADGKSPNCWSSNTKNLDVHYSSGVGNHFFYLLAEGSGSKTFGGVAHSSTTCNGSSVAGIGRSAAERIWFRALDVYMTSGTTYSQARAATISAAGDLYGAGSTQAAAVAAAWSAVSVS
ncbi:Transglutaminase-activating metalloprotease precursor [Nocardioides dokdonensis FR1436]|uniref:Neutral metalloproteinase n=1 Tax=Nocardioides dokdonensis FR1436 TaxID=1300347 RepID=A0A1A9GN66_9ACTN|nr:M4 family metallopeptidase [Nocardioides dokdonensis]ANH39043.1 Transglutaminase-activating metalloprotease precursor [Nocardioides dokdonensis FR1436]